MVKVKFYVDSDTLPRDDNASHRVYFHLVCSETPSRGSKGEMVLLKLQLLNEEKKAADQRAFDSKTVRESDQFKKLRYQLFDENKKKNNGNIICSYCGRVCNREHMHPHQATVDHIKPLSEGGDPFDRANLEIACRKCNKAKRSHSVDSFKDRVKKKAT